LSPRECVHGVGGGVFKVEHHARSAGIRFHRGRRVRPVPVSWFRDPRTHRKLNAQDSWATEGGRYGKLCVRLGQRHNPGVRPKARVESKARVQRRQNSRHHSGDRRAHRNLGVELTRPRCASRRAGVPGTDRFVVTDAMNLLIPFLYKMNQGRLE